MKTKVEGRNFSHRMTKKIHPEYELPLWFFNRVEELIVMNASNNEAQRVALHKMNFWREI